MKKVIFLALAVIGLSLTSCKKDYICKYEVGGVTFTKDYPDQDKDGADAAKAECDTLEEE